MSGERFDQTLVDELEQELKSALSLEPSPDFAAQVRARIARPSPVVDTRHRWRMVLAAAAVCIVAVSLGWLATRRPAPDGRLETTRVGADVRLKPTPPAVRSKTGGALAIRKPKDVRPNRPSLERPEPEIIVAPDAERALARLIELVRNGTVDEDTLRPVVAAAAPAALEVVPLVVPPIPVLEIVTESRTAPGGARQE